MNVMLRQGLDRGKSLVAASVLLALAFAGSAAGQQSSAMTGVSTGPAQTSPAKQETLPKKLKIGSIEVSGNWRVRTEGWNWFRGNSGENDYPLLHSLLRVGIGQQSERFEWKLEAAQDAILALPDNAVVSGTQGQLGLGGTYFVSNGNRQNNANGFVKQAYVRFNKLGPVSLRLGRFEFIDGVERVPKDKTIAALAQTRVSQRLIGNFGWSAVGRSIDGMHLIADFGSNNFTFVGGRPTRGVYQIDAMGELDIDVLYGAYTRVHGEKNSAGRFRLLGIGYFDHRTSVVKTDNRPLAARTADHQEVQIGTFGADYLQVFDAHEAGKFNFLIWGVVQRGSWGVQRQSAGAFIAEAGWQPDVPKWKPWLSAGMSLGSGDDNPNDSTHKTFFQMLPTPRPYARFPFWNLQNSIDRYASFSAQPTAKLTLRSEVHALRLTNPNDLWYLGGGAFQPRTFGYTGRTSNGNRSLANTSDLSADYQFTKSFSVGLYYGHAWGKAVINSIYPKNPNGQFAYIETNFKF